MKEVKQRHSVIVKALILLCAVFQAFTINAQDTSKNRWSVYAGANISHFFEKPFAVESNNECGFGGFVGGGYDIRFTHNWSLTPQVEVAYINNGAKLSEDWLGAYGNVINWRDSWNVMVPVVASFRFNVSEKVGLRIGVGPYAQYAFAARQYNQKTLEKESCGGGSSQFNFGTIEEIAVETGMHFSYMLRFQYPFLKETWTRKTLTVSLGVKYSF